MYKILFFSVLLLSLGSQTTLFGKNDLILKQDLNNDSFKDSIVFSFKSGITKFYLSNNKGSMDLVVSDFISRVLKGNSVNIDYVFININFDHYINFEIELTGRGVYYETFSLLCDNKTINLVKVASNMINKNDMDGYAQNCIYSFINPINIVLFNCGEVIETFNKNKSCEDRFLIKNSFEDIYNQIKESKEVSIPKISRIDYYLSEYPLCKKNVQKYNDIAYYLEQGKNFQESEYLLKQVIKEFPNRIVAYINLGDAYWGLNEINEAKEAYKKYVDLMRESSKENKIPQRVYDRLN